MNDSTRRRRAHPDLYGTAACPGSGLARSTPRYNKWRERRMAELLEKKRAEGRR